MHNKKPVTPQTTIDCNANIWRRQDAHTFLRLIPHNQWPGRVKILIQLELDPRPPSPHLPTHHALDFQPTPQNYRPGVQGGRGNAGLLVRKSWVRSPPAPAPSRLCRCQYNVTGLDRSHCPDALSLCGSTRNCQTLFLASVRETALFLAST